MISIEIVAPEGTTPRVLRDDFHFAAARRVGDRIILSGQTGHLPDMTLGGDVAKQVEVAIRNATIVLEAAGIGWDHVDVVRSWHVVPVGAERIPEDSFNAVHRSLGQLMPNHFPAWTAVALPVLSLPGMLIEIEVEAHA